MAQYTQAQRHLRAETILGEDALLLESFAGEEGVSVPFHFTLNLLSDDPAIAPEKMLRTPVTVTLDLSEGDERPMHGMISRFTQLGRQNQSDLVPRGDGAVALVPVADQRLPDFPESERARDRRDRLQGAGLFRFPDQVSPGLPQARVLRAIPGESPELRLSAPGGRGNLLLLRARQGQAPAHAGRPPQLGKVLPGHPGGADGEYRQDSRKTRWSPISSGSCRSPPARSRCGTTTT